MIRYFRKRLRQEILLFLSILKPVPTVTFLVAAVALTVYWYYGRGKFFQAHLVPILGKKGWDLLDRPQLELGRCLFWCVTAWIAFVIFPQLSIRATTRYTPDDPVPSLGWGLGDWKLGVSACAIFYVVMFVILGTVVIWSGDFQGKYPLCDAATLNLRYFVIYEVGLILYFIAWEYFWRGFFTFSLEKTFGPQVVFVQMLPFVVAHFEKPDLESLSSILGGIALGWLALRTRSFWYGAFIHAATDLTLDIMMTTLKGTFRAH